MYRVSRVEEVDVLDETAERPDDLDVRAEWERLRHGLERHQPTRVDVVARVRPERVELFRRVVTPLLMSGERVRDVPADDEWPHVRMRFRVREAACGILLAFAADAEVVEPVDLREHLLRLASAAVERYG